MKKTILTILQVAVTAGILFWILHDQTKRDQMWNSVRRARLGWIWAGIIAYGVVEIVAAVRWQILLRVQGVRVSSIRLCALFMLGIFFNQFMPGGTGGDVIKIYYLLKETPGKKAQALLATLIDRIIGLLGIIVVAGVLIVWRWDWLNHGQPLPPFEWSALSSFAALKMWLGQVPATTKLLYVLLGILGSSVVGIAASFAITGLGLVHKLPAHMPKRDLFVDLAVAYNAYARAWKSSLAALVCSFGVHLASFLVFFFAARSLAADITFWDLASVMPIINTISALPISVGGTGPREGLFQTLLPAFCSSVTEAQAVTISLTGFAIILLWGLVGGIIYLFYRSSEHVSISVATRTVEALEHEIAESE